MTTTSQKKPRQARAQVTRSAILEATVRILERESLDAATTTRIAEVAGVSVGSLYHYFPHRDAILDALQDREFERALMHMEGVLSRDNLRLEPRHTVELVVRGLADLYAASPALHRVLAIEGLRLTTPERVQAFDLRVIAVIRQFLAARSDQLRITDFDTAAFVAYQSVRATMLASLIERPLPLDGPRGLGGARGLGQEALITQLVELVTRYLVRDELPATSTGPPRSRSSRPERVERADRGEKRRRGSRS
jgi:AcrR family transcriptional regulator